MSATTAPRSTADRRSVVASHRDAAALPSANGPRGPEIRVLIDVAARCVRTDPTGLRAAWEPTMRARPVHEWLECRSADGVGGPVALIDISGRGVR